jgi:hypothetical protein
MLKASDKMRLPAFLNRAIRHGAAAAGGGSGAFASSVEGKEQIDNLSRRWLVGSYPSRKFCRISVDAINSLPPPVPSSPSSTHRGPIAPIGASDLLRKTRHLLPPGPSQVASR